MKEDLAAYIKDLADQFHGLSPDKCRWLCYEFALQNEVPMPDNWKRQHRAVKDWFAGFKERQNLSCRKPEPTSIARATAFNRNAVTKFFENLEAVQERHNFAPNNIYNLDETGVSTVQTPKQVLATKGSKQVGSVTSGERGELVTVVAAVNAIGNAIPIMLVFPRVNYKDHFLRGAPALSIGCATRSGWINEEKFLDFLNHLIKHTRASLDSPILVIMDNHEAHISLRAVNLAKENGVVLVTLPPHTSHKLQPLDRTVFGPLKGLYNRAIDTWMRENPAKAVTIYDVAPFVSDAFQGA